MKNLLLAVATTMMASAGFAQPALIHNIHPAGDSDPNYLTVLGSKLYFAADNGSSGRELWSYSGTGSPAMVHDLNPGAGSSIPGDFYERMIAVGNVLYFPADNGTSGMELYKYTGVGTPVLAAEIGPGSAGSDPLYLTEMNGKIYFNATTLAKGSELYSYDPATNTTKLYDIRAGAQGSNPKYFAILNNKLYFRADNGTNGMELYRYDPATDTCTLAYEVEPGTALGAPGNVMTVGSKIYFVGFTAAHGAELYSFDGTTGTRLTDVAPGPADGVFSGFLKRLQHFNNALYFYGSQGTTDRELFKYDLATGTTALVKDINPSNMSLIDWMTVYDNKLYFTADDGTHGTELWMHDGTNTAMVTDLMPASGDSNPVQLTVWNGALYFNAQDLTSGFELFKYTSTVSGIEHVGFKGKTEIFPNPVLAACRFKLELDESQRLSIVITDGTGKQVYTSAAETFIKGTTELEIPLGHLAPGQYYYALYNERKRLQISGKFLKN